MRNSDWSSDVCSSDLTTRRVENDSRPPSAQPPRDYKGWHIDITFVANPNRYSILHGVEITPYGGDTLFSNMAMAYDRQSPQIKAMIDGVQPVHVTSSNDESTSPQDLQPFEPFVPLAPLVLVHIVTSSTTHIHNRSTPTEKS